MKRELREKGVFVDGGEAGKGRGDARGAINTHVMQILMRSIQNLPLAHTHAQKNIHIHTTGC